MDNLHCWNVPLMRATCDRSHVAWSGSPPLAIKVVHVLVQYEIPIRKPTRGWKAPSSHEQLFVQ